MLGSHYKENKIEDEVGYLMNFSASILLLFIPKIFQYLHVSIPQVFFWLRL